MSDYTIKRDEADVLRDKLNTCHDYIAKLEEECKALKEELREAKLAIEYSRQSVNDEQYKVELRYRDGMIEGLKYAIRCNGVSGGEVN